MIKKTSKNKRYEKPKIKEKKIKLNSFLMDSEMIGGNEYLLAWY